jgi:hypothetical protein
MLMSDVVNELPVEPVFFGVAALGLLLVLLVITLIFGKGRPHA